MITYPEWANSPILLNLGIWVGALLTLAVFSFLIQDNIVFRIAEHIFVGVSIGYLVSTTWHQDIIPQVWQPLKDSWLAYQQTNELSPFLQETILTLIPFIMGLFLFFPFVAPKLNWLMGFPFAYYVGWGAGVVLPSWIDTYIVRQIYGAISPFSDFQQGKIPLSVFLSALLAFIALLCVLSYFFFSLPHKGVLAVTSKIGIWFLMIGFGAQFGFTVMARVSLLLGRILFLLQNWLHLLPPS
ncbi:MAG: hypothetical protein V2G48_07110 [bacterium JZ-2024 1]